MPIAPCPCWLLPASDDMSVRIATLRQELLAAGWKLLTCESGVVSKLSNKASLHELAEEICMQAHLPRHYDSPEHAEYPCVLKAAEGEHGKNVYIVSSCKDVLQVTASGFGSRWLLQELVLGCQECSASLLVEDGEILDVICTVYEYDREEYIWPHGVKEVRRESHSDIPVEHIAVMRAFVCGFSGICNFNYKVRPTGDICIFEVNTRIGADLACDVPRPRARALFERLDSLQR